MDVRTCTQLAQRPITGTWFRALSMKHWNSRLSSTHSTITRSRFNSATSAAPSFRIVYLAENHQVAIHEVGALLGDPAAPISNPKGSWVILCLEIILMRIVDLTRIDQQIILNTNDLELTGNWANYSGTAPTQQLGAALFGLPDLEGFLFRSAKVNARCLAIFPDKLAAASRVEFRNELTNATETLT